MRSSNKVSGLTGVVLDTSNGKDHYWRVRIQKKNLKYSRSFPYNERGRQLAGETYKQMVEKLQKPND